MEITPFYFHPSAELSASWLFDRHIRPMLTQTGRLLSLSYRMILLADDPKLYAEGFHSPWLIWTLSSIDHAEWLRIYFEKLSEIHLDIFGTTKAYEVIPLFREFISHLPRNGWEDPPLCIPVDCNTGKICSSYRLYYVRAFARGPVYRRVRMPYWVRDYKIEGTMS